VLAAAGGGFAGIECRAIGNTVKPSGQGVLVDTSSGLPCQENKSGLERVFCILELPQDAKTHGQDERPMPLGEHCKRFLIILSGEGAEQLAVRPVLGGLTGGERPNMPHDLVK
jgi:hypothetical protein